MPPEPTRPGYTFDGWFLSEEGIDAPTRPTTGEFLPNTPMLTGHKNVYARWVRDENQRQIVTFNPNGGAFEGDNQLPTRDIVRLPAATPTYAQAFDIDDNLVHPDLPHPTRVGFIFSGWFNSEAEANNLESPDGRVLYTDTVTDEPNRTLWARWEHDPSQRQIVRFDPNGGAFAVVPPTPPLHYREIPRVPPGTPTYAQAFDANGNLVNENLTRPVRAGYVFSGWFNSAQEANGTTQAGRVLHTHAVTDYDERTLYARWISINDDNGNNDNGYGNGNGGGGGGGNGYGNGENGEEEFDDPDVPLAYFSPIHHAYLIGYPDGYVRPGRNITRAEVATVFFRLISDDYREHIWTQSNPYPDVILENWFNNAVSTLTSAGYLRGYPDGQFRPNQAMTRAEFSALIVRMVDRERNGGEDQPGFIDTVGHWAESYINIAQSLGWVQGYGDGTFRPDQFITRAEVAALVNRSLNRLPENVDDLLEDMIIWPDNMDESAWYYLYIQEATNTHDHEMKENNINETWIELLTPRAWWMLERPNSTPDIFTGEYIGEGMFY
jgi:uncharacterized repeat protein (TIGR02543 family)